MSNSQNDTNVVTPDAPKTTTQLKEEKSSVVELKNGKAILRQKLLPLEKLSDTLQELVKFRESFEQKIKEGASTIDKFPDEHLPLLAKLVQESERTLHVLSKNIHETLKPPAEEIPASEGDTPVTFSTILPQAVIEVAIATIADRLNYGLDRPGKVPSTLCIWRWEVKENNRGWLPSSVQDKLQTRRLERLQAKEDLRRIFDALPSAEQDSLLKTNKQAKEEATGVISFSAKRTELDQNTPENSQNGEGSSKPNGLKAKKEKITDPEKLAKEKEKAEKKAAKAAKAEKERKEKEAQNKSRSFFSSFIKPKAPAKLAMDHRKIPSTTSTTTPGSPSCNDFERIFKPFIVKKDASVAPINWFSDKRKGREVIVIDGEESRTSPIASSSKLQMDCSDVSLADIVAEARTKSSRQRMRASNLKSYSRYCVRDLMSQLTEAEVVGDDTAVRRISSLLQSRDAIPAKVLIFHEDNRPGYFGTFTKSSSSIGARTPFAKDSVTFDYSYDSGEEWEEEGAGDDLISLDGSAEADASDSDSDMDDFLVPDDDAADPGTPLEERLGSPGLPMLPELSTTNGKRKSTEGVEKKKAKKRRVIPLVPFAKGPCFEERIGDCDYEPFREYRIQLFNDTPFPIDPFKFVSSPFLEARQSPKKKGFAIPQVPAHAQQTQLTNGGGQTSSTMPMEVDSPTAPPILASSASALVPLHPIQPKRVAPPKSPFPDTLLPFLADRMEKLASGNLTWIIDTLYEDLKTHKVKKNAIDAKVREVGEKCPLKKVWKVKDDVLKTLVAPVA